MPKLVNEAPFPILASFEHSDLHWFFITWMGSEKLLKIIGWIGHFWMAFRLGNSISIVPKRPPLKEDPSIPKLGGKKLGNFEVEDFACRKIRVFKESRYIIYIPLETGWIFCHFWKCPCSGLRDYHWWDCPSVSEMVILAALFFNGQKNDGRKNVGELNAMTAWQHSLRLQTLGGTWTAGWIFFWGASLAMIGSFIWHFQGHF